MHVWFHMHNNDDACVYCGYNYVWCACASSVRDCTHKMCLLCMSLSLLHIRFCVRGSVNTQKKHDYVCSIWCAYDYMRCTVNFVLVQTHCLLWWVRESVCAYVIAFPWCTTPCGQMQSFTSHCACLVACLCDCMCMFTLPFMSCDNGCLWW